MPAKTIVSTAFACDQPGCATMSSVALEGTGLSLDPVRSEIVRDLRNRGWMQRYDGATFCPEHGSLGTADAGRQLTDLENRSTPTRP